MQNLNELEIAPTDDLRSRRSSAMVSNRANWLYTRFQFWTLILTGSYIWDEISFGKIRRKMKLTIFLDDSFANVAISFFKTGVMIQPMIGGKLDDRK